MAKITKIVKIGGVPKSSKRVQKGQKGSKMAKIGGVNFPFKNPKGVHENFDRGAPDFLLPPEPCF